MEKNKYIENEATKEAIKRAEKDNHKLTNFESKIKSSTNNKANSVLYILKNRVSST